MRLSCDPRFCGYAQYLSLGPNAKKVEVFFNGEQINHCIVADEELGEVLLLKRDDKGAIIVINHQALEEWKSGKVEIKLPPGVLE